MAVSAKNIPAPDLVTVRRALLSVSDKTGLVPFATLLDGLGIELVSTGGTAKAIAEAGLPVRDDSQNAQVQAFMDGIVSYQHPDHDTQTWPPRDGRPEEDQ